VKKLLGNFRLMAFAPLKVAGREQSIYRVDISTVRLPAGEMRALWDSEIRLIKALPALSGANDAMVRVLRNRGSAVFLPNYGYGPSILSPTPGTLINKPVDVVASDLGSQYRTRSHAPKL
jgi:hypothetical protein